LNPRFTNHQALQNPDLPANESYSPSPVEIGGAVPELVEREPARTTDLLLFLVGERRFTAKAVLIGMVVAAIISLLIPPQYQSITRIMPPDKQGLGGLAAMLATASEGGAGSLVGGIVSDAVGLKTSGAVYSAILRSNAVQNTIVDRFDLRHVYRVRYQKDARERLSDMTDITEDRKSGIISITVTDRSPKQAADIAESYVDTLDSLTAQLNTSAAHRERLFIEDRLKTVKQELDAASRDLSEFSSKNLTLDIKEEGKAMVGSAAALEGELIAAESQLSGLKQVYNSNNVRVRSLQARVSFLRSKLSELRGTAGDPENSGSTSNPDFDVSIAKLPALGITYYDLYRRVRIQETVFEILTKQYELAKIEEAKELPSIKVLDRANLPETKSSPKRTLMTLVGGILAVVLAIGYLMASFQFRTLGPSHPFYLVGLKAKEGMSEDVEYLRSDALKPVLRMLSRFRTRFRDQPSSPAPPR
jgi:capsule polysaccharide export protein KpsE/RkpR